MLSLGALCLFCLVTLDAPDMVLIEQRRVSIPFTGASEPFDRFLLVGPMLVTAVGMCLHMLIGYWRNLGVPPEAVPLPFLFNINRLAPSVVCHGVFYWMIPLVLYGFAWKARPAPAEFRRVGIVAAGWALSMMVLYVWRQCRPPWQVKKSIVALVIGVVLSAMGFRYLQSRAFELAGVNLRNRDLRRWYLRGANMREASLEGARLDNSSLSGANLQGANLRGADLSGAELIGANLSGADLELAQFAAATLQGSTLEDAIIVAANFQGANLLGVDLSGARLSSATGLTQEQIDKTCADQRTTLPNGLRKPAVCR